MNLVHIAGVEIDIDSPIHPDHDVKQLVLRLLAKLNHHEQLTNERHNTYMTALEVLSTSVSNATKAVGDLTTAVDDAITHIGTPGATDAQLGTLADSIDALTATLGAQSKRLADAVNPPVVAVLPPPTP